MPPLTHTHVHAHAHTHAHTPLKKTSLTGVKPQSLKGRGSEPLRGQFKSLITNLDLSNSKATFTNLLPCHSFYLEDFCLFWDLVKAPPAQCFSYPLRHSWTFSVSRCVRSFPRLILSHIALYISLGQFLADVFIFFPVRCILYTDNIHLTWDFIRRSKASLHRKTAHSHPTPSGYNQSLQLFLMQGLGILKIFYFIILILVNLLIYIMSNVRACNLSGRLWTGYLTIILKH